MIELLACPACARHVRAGDDCPFCGAATADIAPRRRPVARRARAAVLFAGAMTLGAACGGGGAEEDEEVVVEESTGDEAGEGTGERADESGAGAGSELEEREVDMTPVPPYGTPALDALV